MKVKTIIGLIGLLIISASCEKKHNNQSIDAVADSRAVTQVVHADIKEICEKLPQIQTPVTFNSNREIELSSADESDNELLITLKKQMGFSTFGRIFETEDFVTIIGYVPDDVGTPILLTFDKSGNELSSHAIYETVMGDMGRYTANSVTISPDRLITLTDSTVTRQINAEGDDEVPGTDSLTVTKRQYKITDAGLIEKVE